MLYDVRRRHGKDGHPRVVEGHAGGIIGGAGKLRPGV